MLLAYLDESGLDSDGGMFIAGHVGNERDWLLFDEKWKAALGERKALHMRTLRWRNPDVKELLGRLGPVPGECGLTRVVSSIKASDYTDLITSNRAKKVLKPYVFALTGLVLNVARGIADREQVHLILAEQPRYADLAKQIIGSVAGSPAALSSWGAIKVKEFSFLPNDGFARLDQADYFAYALLQLYRDAETKRAEWTKSILGDMTGIGAILTREQVRLVMEVGNSMVFTKRNSDAQGIRR